MSPTNHTLVSPQYPVQRKRVKKIHKMLTGALGTFHHVTMLVLVVLTRSDVANEEVSEGRSKMILRAHLLISKTLLVPELQLSSIQLSRRSSTRRC